MAELFDDHSPLQLGAAGRYKGQTFTLIGRLQYAYGEGRWSEWLALMADGSAAILSEDNGAYVFCVSATLERELPDAQHWRVGMSTAVNGKRYSVASSERVSLVAAQGELPKLPPLGKPFAVVDLRSDDDEVLSIEYPNSTPPEAPRISRGHAVQLDDLQLSGLKAESAKEEKGRIFNCPNCAAPVAPLLAASKSMTCASCHSLIDLQAGLGGELRHAVQTEPVAPLISLGSSGLLQAKSWQVVGFQHRIGKADGQFTEIDEEDDERFGWSEYLLYNQRAGFCFLVDAEDGWSLVRPLVGAPQWKPPNRTVSYQKTQFRLQLSYSAETTYAAGEFYWQVQRGQYTHNVDFASGKSVLSREEGGQEVTWSRGTQLSSSVVARAFNLLDKQEAFERGDIAPISANMAKAIAILVLVFFLIVAVLAVVSSAGLSCNPDREYCGSSSRSSGGSYGGFSGGGGHK